MSDRRENRQICTNAEEMLLSQVRKNWEQILKVEMCC